MVAVVGNLGRMPDAEETEIARGGKALTVVFWIGIALAPLAALLLLASQSAGALKIAAVLAILAVVLIGLSLVLKRDAESVRIELEDMLLDEVDALRADIRQDIATASRTTHRALADKIQAMQQTIENLRGQLDAMRGVIPGIPQPHLRSPNGTAGRGAQRPPAVAGQPPHGVVRHTETVQVTTRQTIVDPADERGGGRVYGQPGAPAYTGSRRDDRPRGREDPWERPAPTTRRSAEDGYTRSGDRWASVRADEHGRELLMGEHRQAVRSDGLGTEMHIEDRWASVRRADERGVDVDGPSGFWSDNWDAEPDDDRARKSRRRALPSEPADPDERWAGSSGYRDEPIRSRRMRDEDEYDRR
jgi:hypothetical protein